MSPSPTVTVLAGPTAVGKGTVSTYVRDHYPDVWLSVSATTRAPRPGEVDGVHYFFVRDDEFDRMIDEANVCRAPLRHSRQKPPSFSDVPLDPRPYIKSNSRGGRTRIASADDFPMHWL